MELAARGAFLAPGRCRLDLPGFRTRQIILVTTLLDSAQYPPAALGQLYYRRWAMELTLRNLENHPPDGALELQNPRQPGAGNPDALAGAHLVRRLMLESARTYRVPLERLSFAGALACARRYGEAPLARPAPNAGALSYGRSCSGSWLKTWCRSGQAGASRGPSNAAPNLTRA